MAETDAKNYEITYLISPDIPEDGVFGEAGKITGAIQDARGLIGRIEEPKKRKLAYPIEKMRNAYFGWTTFSVAPERLPDIEKRIAAEPAIMRYLLVEEVKRPVHEFRPRFRRERPTPGPVAGEIKPFAPAAPKEEDKTKIEELDKRLEEILGK
ncbi:MAG: 30S ribosomal protein S6 [Candidatus Sungbacteria bacterium]|uniref:Small ribosomal subunit protein bS6 n=1 Tax=Candidatus Sungiibacteriota bacterium TaxID=2750080 RepID=A0A932YW99_9BACT|nr:30S ribosomal protein S6 [Candidatus Sungbacteria bacterium]